MAAEHVHQRSLKLMAIGTLAGLFSVLFGVGGGVLFVPGLVLFLGLGQHQAEATSLLAIVPVAIVGTYRHFRGDGEKSRRLRCHGTR